MKPDQMVETVDCETAEQFISEMSVSHGRLWSEARISKHLTHDWLLRGMTMASWPLRPSAFRPNALCRLWVGQTEYTPVSAADARNLEDLFVSEFATYADEMGFSIPGDRPELRDRRRARKEYNPFEFPPIDKLHIYALAQHYGVPTRLLDWTTRPLVAAYFAVEKVARIRAGLVAHDDGPAPNDYNKPCAVWAIQRNFLEHIGENVISPRIITVTAPKATNPNLAAQGGVFTVVQPIDEVGDVYPLPDIDVIIQNNAALVPIEWERHAPFAYKFVLAAKEARVALRMLAAEGIHAGTIYPGLGGVAAAMAERKAHQWAQKASR